ncbi:Retrotransposon gag protein [Arachis hypogaea]|nr:Retrotransposon gag protein [Arachis hypogaea]
MGSVSRNPNNDPYSQTYNQGWRNHPNFGWRDQPQKPQNFNNNSQGGFQQKNHNKRQFLSHQQQPPPQANSKSQEDSNWEMMRSFVQETIAQPTGIALQMADKSMKPAYGLVENILVKVGKFFLQADFVILDTMEDENASIILGRTFLVTGRALIDVEVGEIVLRVHNEQLVFHVFKDIHSAGKEERCMQTELIDPNLQEPPDDAQ